MSLDASTYRLPSELTDRILDFLHDDRRALASCALTCRGWLPTSRHHLFHTLRQIPIVDVEPLARLLEEDPSLGSYIEHLELGRPTISVIMAMLYGRPPPLHLGILEPSRMSNLRKLIVCDVVVEAFLPFSRLLFTLPKLEELSIGLALVCEDYEKLRIERRSEPEWLSVPIDGVAPLALRSLRIYSGFQQFPYSFFPGIILAIRDHLNLKKFALDISPAHFWHWIAAIQAISGTLLSLQLSIYGADEGKFHL